MARTNNSTANNGTTTTAERNPAFELLVSTVQSTHGTPMKDIVDLHTEVKSLDPIFYGQMGVWAFTNTHIRDHQELFIAGMFLADSEEVREAASVLLKRLPPYRVDRVISKIKEVFKHNAPRRAITAVREYLREREKDALWFDKTAIRAKKILKSLYARTHTKPSKRAKAILFGPGKIEDGIYGKVKSLMAKSTITKKDIEEAFELQIPYPILAGIMPDTLMNDPKVLALIIANTSDQEFLSVFDMLQRRGATTHIDLKKLIQAKLEKIAESGRIDPLKAHKAATFINDKALVDKLHKITDAKLAQYKITKPTTILIDTSGSMEVAIDVAKQIGALVGSRCTAGLSCYKFAVTGKKLDLPERHTYRAWSLHLSKLRASGWTSIGSAVRQMRRLKDKVEQIILISDCCENRAPYFVDELLAYQRSFDVMPHVLILQVGRYSTNFLNNLDEARIPYDVFRLNSSKIDYYSLPNILSLLSRPSLVELFESIQDIELPTKESTAVKAA